MCNNCTTYFEEFNGFKPTSSETNDNANDKFLGFGVPEMRVQGLRLKRLKLCLKHFGPNGSSYVDGE